MYYAHIRWDDRGAAIASQTVAEHLSGTAALSRAFAEAFGAGDDGELIGLLHDLGKCTDGFQNRLLRDGPRVDHATAGAVACSKYYGRFEDAACIAGHHSGLPDFGNVRTDCAGDATLYGRLKKGIAEQYLESCGESGMTLPDLPRAAAQPDRLCASFRTRMLYSCLVDADFLDTEHFMDGDRGRGGYDDIPTLLARLEKYIAPWQNPQNELNRLRCDILNTCLEAGAKAKGLYTLTVPTGGGKTVASLAFALRHAAVHGMQRVIYVIPYTSIIEQNAAVFRDILGAANVLEHHCGVQLDLSDGAPPEEVRRALAAENWDIPVVVTTAVQLFESLYANRSSRCRKLHNLANSVIVFDEAQMLPLPHLRPCVAAMASLTAQFRSTVVLCTATQPSLGDLLAAYAPGWPVEELCPQTAALYELLPREGSFHLSTLMIPAQRQAFLHKIQERLRRGEVCRVVSTSLIEAGVDVDFPLVYREMAGLDSILQAAGRCNREGKRPIDESVVTIFERTEPPPTLFRQAIGAAVEALHGGRDPGAPETMARYFCSLRSLKGDALDKNGVIRAFTEGVSGCDMPFQTVAESFHLIESNTHTVYVPFDEGSALIERLAAGECSRALYRALGRYAVSVYEPHFQALYAAGAILTAQDVPTLDSGSAILRDMSLYSETMGLTLEPETGKALMI